jgi:hypothetical protein
MGVHAELRREDGTRLREFADPSGGFFDAAGDFDRLLPLNGRVDEPFRLLQYVDPYGDTVFNTVQMADLLTDVERALSLSQEGPERRGLERLRVLAERCRDEVHLYVWFVGD